MSEDHPRIVSIGGVAFDARRFVSADRHQSGCVFTPREERRWGVVIAIEAGELEPVELYAFDEGDGDLSVDEVAKAVREALEA